MTKNELRRIIAILLAVISVVLLAVGVINLFNRSSNTGKEILETSRLRSIINTACDVETFVEIARDEANKAAITEFSNLKKEIKKLPKEEQNKVELPKLADLSEKRQNEAEAAVRKEFAESTLDYASIKTEKLEDLLVTYQKQLSYADDLAKKAKSIDEQGSVPGYYASELDTNNLTSLKAKMDDYNTANAFVPKWETAVNTQKKLNAANKKLVESLASVSSYLTGSLTEEYILAIEEQGEQFSLVDFLYTKLPQQIIPATADVAEDAKSTQAAPQQEINKSDALFNNLKGLHIEDARILAKDEYQKIIASDEYLQALKDGSGKVITRSDVIAEYTTKANNEFETCYNTLITATNEYQAAHKAHFNALADLKLPEDTDFAALDLEQGLSNAKNTRNAAYKEMTAVLKEFYPTITDGKFLSIQTSIESGTSGLHIYTFAQAEAACIADLTYNEICPELLAIDSRLTKDSVSKLKESIAGLVFQRNDTFDSQYDRFAAVKGTEALKDPFAASLVRYADDILYAGMAILVLAAMVLYFELLSKKLGIPRIVLGSFFILLCFLCLWFDLSLPALLSNTLVRLGMNSIMVLAMVPGIQCGISLNLGLPIGLVAGLVGGLCTIEWGIPGVAGFLTAIAVGMLIAAVAGWMYAQMLNRLKGEEMSVTTYVGFSIVSLMCIAWLVLPFTSLKLRWPMGTGLRNTIGLDETNFRHILDDFLSFSIGDFVVPTGALLFMALMCLLVWLFSRSKTGVAMSAVGNNPRFAEATGINVNKMRVIGTVLSTILGAIGILVYSQSYGFMQLYTAPRQMGFVAASAILIGGATTSRGKISNVLIGTFLFQGVLTLGMPVANVLVPGSTLSETLRILISNGIILYALTKSGGGSRG